jgi:hypothetical protein
MEQADPSAMTLASLARLLTPGTGPILRQNR